MKPLTRHLKRHWPLLLWLAVAMVLFWPVRGYYVALPSPDSAPFFPAGHRLRLLEQLLAGATAISPHHLLSLLIPPLPLNDLFYLFDTLLIAVGMAWFLRGRDLPPVAAAIGGGILAFAGYSFTLVAAGHMGFFHMTAYASFMFGALVRALRHGRWQHYVLAGILASWTLLFAPDFGPLVLALAACYALWLLLCNVDGTPWSQRWPTLARGLPLALLCFALGSWPTIRTIFTEHVAHREAQIAGSTPAGNRAAAAEERPDDPQARWIFATNWSLHPSELVEFVAPNLFGTQSGDPAAPYWGKLGRTLGWEEHHQGFANFRQHTIYLGAAQLLLAALALAAWWSSRRRGRTARGECAALKESCDATHSGLQHDSGAAQRMARPFWLADIPFWSIVWLVGLLLALGRHAPLYRLFYALPYMSLLRAPVKFMRYVEFATAVLAASGLAALLAAEKRRLRGWIAVAGVIALLLLVAALWCHGATAAIQQHLLPLQLTPVSHLLQRNLVYALLHGAAACAIIAALLALRTSRHYRPLLLLLPLALWLALDFTLVNRRFIQAWDLTAHYRPNSVVKRILAEGGPAPVVANYITPSVTQDWFSHSLGANSIFNCVPSPNDRGDNKFRELMLALERDQVRFWELCGADYAVVPFEYAKALGEGRAKPISAFKVSNGYFETIDTIGNKVAVLLRIPGAMPYAWLTASWINVPPEESVKRTIESANRNVVVLVDNDLYNESMASPAHQGAGDVTVQQHRNKSLRTVLFVDTPIEQFLVIRISARTKIPLVVYLDNKKTVFQRANHTWIGVKVPPGKHVVHIQTQIDYCKMVLSLLPAFVVLLTIGFLLPTGANCRQELLR